jgi:signal transduction histidine kinase
VQQSLANIHRHSDSRVAEIRFATQTDRITVEIRDEGHGIPVEKLAEFQSGKYLCGVGIAGMRERIRDMQGQFDIRSGETGTTIAITLPISQTAKSAASA